jgi:hypothetical protein
MFDDPRVRELPEIELIPEPNPKRKRKMRFHEWEEVALYGKTHGVYPVVEKRGDAYFLRKAFRELTDARKFLEGTRYLVWYTPEAV